MNNDIIWLSASQALELFKSGELSPVDLMTALKERSELLGSSINPFLSEYWEQALTQAHSAEKKYKNKTARELEGLPFCVKTDTNVEGQPTTDGSLVLKDNIADHTSPIVERMLQAGAILHARTNCPEMAWAWVCYSNLHGVTRNPWNPDITSGGSTGGGAAALAAGMTTISLGSDSAGSIRMPAAMCGVLGYKPPLGRNPQGRETPEAVSNVFGPQTRTVADCVLIQNVIAGPHPDDHTAIRPKLYIKQPLEDIKNLKIAWSPDLDCLEVSPDVLKNTLECVVLLKKMGAVVEKVNVEWAEEAMLAGECIESFTCASDWHELVQKHKDVITDYVFYFAEDALKITRDEFIESFYIVDEAWMEFSLIMRKYDAFISPTVTTTEIPAEMKPWEELRVNGKPVKNDHFVTTPLPSLFPGMPALTVPSGISDNGVPTGIQICGRPYDDVTVFRIAAALEREKGLFKNAQARPA